MIINFDFLNRFQTPTITLCNPDSRYIENRITRSIGTLSEVTNFSVDYNFGTYSSGSFDYYWNSDLSQFIYYSIKKRRYIFIEGFGFCVITNVTETRQDEQWVKNVSFSSCDKELENFEAPYLLNDDEESITIPLYSDSETSALGEAIDICRSWSIKNFIGVNPSDNSKSLKELLGTFTEATAKNLFEYLYNDLQDVYEIIIDCNYITREFTIYTQEAFISQMKTSVFIPHNLYESVSNSENTDDDYTALNVVGDNALDIRMVNPVGNNIVYNFDAYKSWMTPELKNAIDEWQNNINAVESLYKSLNLLYIEAKNDFYNLLQDYNALYAQMKNNRESFIYSYKYYLESSEEDKKILLPEVNKIAETYQIDLYGGMVKNNEFAKVIVLDDIKESNTIDLDFGNEFYFQLQQLNNTDGANQKWTFIEDKDDITYGIPLYKMVKPDDWSLYYFCYEYDSDNQQKVSQFWNVTEENYRKFLSSGGYQPEELDKKFRYDGNSMGNSSDGFFTLDIYKIKFGLLHYGMKCRDDLDDLNIEAWRGSHSQKDLSFYRFNDLSKLYDFSISGSEDYISQLNTSWVSNSKKKYGELLQSNETLISSSNARSISFFFRNPDKYYFNYQSELYPITYSALDGTIQKIIENCSFNTKSHKILKERNIEYIDGTQYKEYDYFTFVLTNDGGYRIDFHLDNSTIFNDNLLDQLSNYIITGEFNYNKLTITDTMSIEEQFEQAYTLYTKAKTKLRIISDNIQKFTIDVKSFIFDRLFAEQTAQLRTGCLITVEISQNIFKQIFLTNFSVNYSEKTLSLTLGNQFYKYDIKSLFDDVLGDISKSASQITRLAKKIYKIEQQLKNS